MWRLLPLLCVLALAACGGDDPSTQASTTTVTAAVGTTPYAHGLQRLCQHALAAHTALGSASDPTELLHTLPKANAIDQRLLQGVRALHPSAAEAKRAGRLLYFFSAMSDIQYSALGQLQAGNTNGYFQYMDSALAARGHAEKLALSLGAPACAQRPSTR
jgi:hypothetical protein